MSPLAILTLAVLITAVAIVVQLLIRRIHSRRLRKLAAQWQMNYSPRDQFRLSSRVARDFPVPGASRTRVLDLIYGVHANVYRYVFTAEYTTGVVTGKQRVQRAATFTEPRETGGDGKIEIVLAPAKLPLIEQYQMLAPDHAKANSPP